MSDKPAIIDISVPIAPGMAVWPGDPDVEVTQVLSLAQGDAANVTRLTIGAHTGTHVDAFCHFKPEGKAMEAMALERYVGPARVVEIDDPHRITADALLQTSLAGVNRVLFKTRNSAKRWYAEPFNPDFVHLTPEAATVLVETGIQLVGIDYLSVEGYHVSGAPVHHRLMEAGIYIVEGLYLGEVVAGDYELICLPLNIKNGDGAPARTVLRPLSTGIRDRIS